MTKVATRRILVIDDDAFICDLFAEQLIAAGFVVDKARSAQEAMDMFVAHHYDAMTLDYNMPGMSGTQLHFVLSKGYGYGRKVSELIPQRLPPTLVITGNISEPRVQELKNAENVVEILEKPIKGRVLIDAINAIIAKQVLHEENRQRMVERLGTRLLKRSV